MRNTGSCCFPCTCIQRRRRHCLLFSIYVHFPKLDVAGSCAYLLGPPTPPGRLLLRNPLRTSKQLGPPADHSARSVMSSAGSSSITRCLEVGCRRGPGLRETPPVTTPSRRTHTHSNRKLSQTLCRPRSKSR